MILFTKTVDQPEEPQVIYIEIRQLRWLVHKANQQTLSLMGIYKVCIAGRQMGRGIVLLTEDSLPPPTNRPLPVDGR